MATMVRFFAFLPPRAASFSPQAPEIGVGAEGTERIVSGLDREPSQHSVPGSGDPQLRVPLAGTALLGHQSHVGSDGAAGGKARRILQGEHIAQGRQAADSRDLPEHGGLLVGALGHLLDPAIPWLAPKRGVEVVVV